MTTRRWSALALALVLAFAPNVHNGRSRHDHALIRRHACVSVTYPLVPPVAGYLLADVRYPRRGLFYRSVDELTAGLLVGEGGDWKMVYWCRR